MGKRVTVTLFDDLEPELEASTERNFAVDGVEYHLDLSDKNAKAFDKDLAKWLEVATRVGRAERVRRRTNRITHSGGEPGLPLAEIRQWARANGFDISDKGRVSAEVVRAWKAATSEAEPEKKPAAKKAAPRKDAPEFSAAQS
ncbi:Lsr2-like DNA bridging protein [Mycobacterium phage Halena]|uniref:Lsr2-like DNA bridging protein n=10 Tax=Bronvirus TaxID=1623278 RepID=E0YPG6_9CAUD|nr:nucloid associated Lsr2-like [Mycobacterium phage LeBron]YP_009635878.1 nucloid associated Lsr2-like [Mycobacterium phage JoeDirt]YP_010100929.1 nucloid associated Lsr2-like [Mycobacterium phage CicholasNage]YP_010101339.1 nucloid associated Lsr2-like [Mycobacterium phage Silverleaf]YP_010105435.1 nucloid associated Lsr2-like [Mycobacterium phage DirkDirk]YP_010114733.1 nucloid associated Lsr2-like [Mycobacterium phage OhShagHennessy]AEK07638.1 Lsr2-like DNA bridging protein [Mycobacterium